MKRVKMMLTAVAVLTLVGGALAFKAQKFNTKFIYTQKNPVSGFCTVKLTSRTITSDDPGTAKIFAATSNNVPCLETWTTAVPNE